MTKMIFHSGSCHCGAVTYKVEAPDALNVTRCNCSICTKSGNLHLIVPRSRFKLLTGEDHLTTYTFNTGIAKHLFCKICGIKSFYTPRSQPDGVSVNVHCLEPATVKSLNITPFDGRHWEQSIAGLLSFYQK